MKRPSQPQAEVSVTDGTRHIGKAIPRSEGFEAFDAAGRYLAKFETRREAVQAIVKADREPSRAGT